MIDKQLLIRVLPFIAQALSVPVRMKWMSESLETSIDGNTSMQMHVIDIVANSSASFLGVFSRFLVTRNFRVQCAGCYIHKGYMKCVIYVVGARTETLLWQLQLNMGNRTSLGPFKIIVHRVGANEFSHLSRRLHNLKAMDLASCCNSSNIHVHQRKELKEDAYSAEVAVCLPKSESLIHVSSTLADMDYKISRAFFEYPGPYKFLVILQPIL